MIKQANLRKFLGKGVPFVLPVVTDEGEMQLSFRLVFDFNALALVEALTGYSLLTGAIFSHLNATTASILFWAAIQAHNPEFKDQEGLECVRSMMNLKNNDFIQIAVQEAFIQSLPDEQATRIRAAIEEAKSGVRPLAPTTETSATE